MPLGDLERSSYNELLLLQELFKSKKIFPGPPVKLVILNFVFSSLEFPGALECSKGVFPVFLGVRCAPEAHHVTSYPWGVGIPVKKTKLERNNYFLSYFQYLLFIFFYTLFDILDMK